MSTKIIQQKNIFAGLFLIFVSVAAVFAQGTGFNFQGRLNDGMTPANGSYDLEFRLYDAITGGNQIGSLASRPNTTLINGVFSVTLDFGATAFNNPNSVYIEIAVKPNGSPNAYTILGPRQQLTVVPSALQAGNSNQLGGIPASEYVTTTSNAFVKNSTTPQTANFNVSGNGIIGGTIQANGGATITGVTGDGAVITARRTSGDSFMIIDSTTVSNSSVLAFRKNNFNRWLMFADSSAETGSNAGSDFKLDAYNNGGGIANYLFIKRSTGNVGIGTIAPTAKLQVVGTTRTNLLQITGGSDVAENFEFVEAVTPGMVVAIDPNNAGKLIVARGVYNRRVAGIISGANNLAVGMLLPDLTENSNSSPVALSGRVWVYADAGENPIIPGDLLTTSDTPGHAMKVTNHKKAQGAIIGKAMTNLKSGKGLVLVLVSLQ